LFAFGDTGDASLSDFNQSEPPLQLGQFIDCEKNIG